MSTNQQQTQNAKVTESERENWEMIGHLNYDIDAEIVASLFDSQNIPMVIQGRNHRRMLGFIGGYIELRVLVPRAYQEQGKALLDQYHQQKDDPDFREMTEEEKQGERSFLLFSDTSRKMGIALFLDLFLGFGLGALSVGLLWVTLILAPLQACAYIPQASAWLADLLSTTPETYQSVAKLYIPLIDLGIAWTVLLFRALVGQKQDH